MSANTIFNPPQILSTSPSVSCSNKAANLQATSNTDDIEWWDSQTGGTLLGTGTSFNPVLSEDTIFWVYPSNNGCSNGTRTSVSATVNLAPLPTVTTPYDLCDIDTDGTLSNDGLALFDLSTKESEIINGQTDVTISFHLSPTNALDGSNPVSTSFINTSPYSELLFVRLENATSNCYAITTLTVNVLPSISTSFNQLDPICEGDAFALPLTSIEGITGTWSPAIDNTTSTLYTFSPDPGQCASEASMAITVIAVITPTFTQVDTICVGDTLLNLSTTSNNSITGTWSPAIDNTTTTEYTFTPNAGLSCVLPVTMTITVLTQTVPEFTQVDPICIGSTITPLPQISTNGITGTWFPSSNNLQTTTYTFSSDPGQCAGTTAMTIIVDPISTLTVSAT
ncbi:MAG: Ig-like domain-containing protein, partial [Methylophagaceae bacterium]